jgi:hypothetical protein
MKFSALSLRPTARIHLIMLFHSYGIIDLRMCLKMGFHLDPRLTLYLTLSSTYSSTHLIQLMNSFESVLLLIVVWRLICFEQSALILKSVTHTAVNIASNIAIDFLDFLIIGWRNNTQS